MNKKIFLAGLLCLASVASVVGTVGNAREVEALSAGNTIYLKPVGNWLSANQRFAAVFTNSGWKDETWVSMEHYFDGVYSCKIPSNATYQVQFQRMDGTSTTNNWNSKWNSSATFTLNRTQNFATLNDGWNDVGCTWSNYQTPAKFEEGKELFLNTNGWNNTGAWFAAYFYGPNDSSTWVKMEDKDSNGIYEFSVPNGTWFKLICCRMDSGKTELSWESKWNQTGDLTPNNGNLFKVDAGKFEKGSWENYEAKSENSYEVKALFTEYYGEGSYTKDSVLNTSKMADHEVAKYFHASADTKYRKTVYSSTWLKMTTSTDGKKYENESIYKDENGKVVHTGFGGDWTVNKPSVEDWFVTLKDFVDASTTGWEKTGTVYSHVLEAATATGEDDLTRMAREFVAPMWLEPNANNWNYVTFTKLTVEEDNNTLVMKLYVDEQDSTKLEPESNNVFSQVTIY